MQDGRGRLDISVDDEFVDGLYYLLFSCKVKRFKKYHLWKSRIAGTYGLHACQRCQSNLTAFLARY